MTTKPRKGLFTDGDDVILIASNYGGARHPGWYYNLVAHPECELRIGQRGGRFMAQETQGVERDRSSHSPLTSTPATTNTSSGLTAYGRSRYCG